MTRAWAAGRWDRLAVLGLLLAVWACGDDGGDGCDAGCDGCDCDGSDGEAYVFPESGVIMQQAVQVKLTERGMSFVEENLEPILGEVLGEEGLSFCLESISAGPADICYRNQDRCPDGEIGCDLQVELGQVSLTPVAPNRLNLEARVSINEDLPFRVRAIGIDWVSCTLEIRGNDVRVPAAAVFDVAPPPGERTSVRVVLPDDDEIDRIISDMNLRVRRTGFLQLAQCGILDLLRGVVVDIAKDQLIGPLEDAVTGFTCRPCSAGCPTGSTCDDRGVCMAGNACVPQALGLEGEFDVGSLLSDFAPGLEARLGYLVYLANYANAVPRRDPPRPDSGLELAAQLGIAAEPNACVPDSFKEWGDVFHPRSETLNAGITPGGEPYAVGVGVATRALDLALWGAWRSGALCISIGSDAVEQITTSTFGLLIQSLRNVTEGRNLPMQLQLNPQRPPEIRLGPGTVEPNPDGDGPGRLIEPLIEVIFHDLDIDAYVWVFDRWLRVFTLNVDIELPLGLDISSESGLYILLDAANLSDAFTRIEARDGELLAANELANIANVLPSLLGIVVPLLGDFLDDPIELPEFFGFRLRLTEESIQAIDDNAMLAIFADLEPVPPAALMQSWGVSVLDVRSTGLQGPALAEAYRRATDTTTPMDRAWIAHRVELLPLDPLGLGQRGWEVSYRINGGLWSMWEPGPSFELADPRLFMAGRHDVEVRLRPAGEPWSRLAQTASFELLTDLSPPNVDVFAGAESIELQVHDPLYELGELEARYAVDGVWSAWQPATATLPWPVDSAQDFVFQLEVRDPAGHVASVENVLVRPVVQRGDATVTRSDESAGAGCAATQGQGGSPWGLFLVALVLGGALRRRGVALLALLSIGILGAGCSDGASRAPDAQPCSEEVPCDEGFVCLDGFCVEQELPGEACVSTDECEVGEACVDGACVVPDCSTLGAGCDLRCEDGAQGRCGPDGCFCARDCAAECEGDSYCCAQSGRCTNLPDPCASQSCPTGQRPERTEDPAGDGLTCTTVSDGACGCVDLDPLSLGDHGRWLDAAGHDDHGVYVTTYNQTYGDLMVGRYADGDFDWHYVDGLPPAGSAVTGQISGPRAGVAVAGPNVGRYPSIAVGDDGALHVAYQVVDGASPESLRYGWSDGDLSTWTFIDLDTTRLSGFYTRTTLDADGRPWIVYLVPRIADVPEEGPAVWRSELRLARATTATPESVEDFEIVTLYASTLDLGCGGICTGSARCRADLNLCAASSNRGCSPSCEGGARCFEDPDGETFTCAQEITFPAYLTPLATRGMHADLAWLPGGNLGIASYDSIEGRLLWTVVDPENLEETTTEALDGGTESSGHVGAFPAVVVTETDEVFVAYMDVDRTEALIRNVGTQTLSVIDEGFRPLRAPYRVGRVGSGLALAEFDGFLTAFYMDATRHELVESRFIFDGVDWSWEATPIEGGSGISPYPGAAGLFNRVVTTSAGTWAFTYKMNFQASPVRRAVVAIER